MISLISLHPAFEKKTDITTAINIATKKRLPLLVQELQAKLAAVRPNVTHTTVKESKEIHLLSKNLKTELAVIAMRRFQRARENALEQVIGIMTEWARCESGSCNFLCSSTHFSCAKMKRFLRAKS